MPYQKKDFPKVPPPIIQGASGKAIEEPDTQPTRRMQSSDFPSKNGKNFSQLQLFSSLITPVSVISLLVAMIGGVWFAHDVLALEPNNADQNSPQVVQPQNSSPPNATNSQNDTSDGDNNRSNILPKVIVVGVAYLIGWIFSAYGVRILGNLILPYAIRVYAWIVLGGILILQVLIMSRLYQQEYLFSSFVKYLFLFGAGMIALVGLHLILERHSLIPFGVFILLISLGHLYSIVYHYILRGTANYGMLWGDLIFFFVTFSVSLLMLAHFGLLNGMRRRIDRMFDPKTNKFVPRS